MYPLQQPTLRLAAQGLSGSCEIIRNFISSSPATTASRRNTPGNLPEATKEIHQ